MRGGSLGGGGLALGGIEGGEPADEAEVSGGAVAPGVPPGASAGGRASMRGPVDDGAGSAEVAAVALAAGAAESLAAFIAATD